MEIMLTLARNNPNDLTMKDLTGADIGVGIRGRFRLRHKGAAVDLGTRRQIRVRASCRYVSVEP